MKILIFSLILSFLISLNAVAKTIDQKKEELKKIYEAGGISKIEYKKAVEFLEEPEEKEKKAKKKSLSLVNKKEMYICAITIDNNGLDNIECFRP